MTGHLRLQAVLIVCLLTVGRVWAATPAEYDSALAEVQAALSEQARAVTSGTSLTTSRTPPRVAARVLAPILTVQPVGGAPRPADTSLLRQTIAAADALHDRKQRVLRLRELSLQVAILRHELTIPDAGTGTAARTGRGAVDAAHTVLAGAAYDSDPLPPPTQWERLRDRMARAIERWWASLHFSPHPYTGPMPSISPQFINGIVIALAAGLFALLVALLVSLLRRRAANARPATLDETEAALVEARDTDSLHALAERKAREGDYRLALRFIYLALLVALDTGGILRFDRSRTNWEYLRALRAAGRDDVFHAMTPLTREFDRVWYGLAHADAADYARALSQYEALQAASLAESAPKKAAATS